MQRELSPSERHTWRLIQEHYQEIPNLSISELAARAFVSISTVNRTVQKKGFKGYSDFRYSVREKQIPKSSKFSVEILAAISKNEEEIQKTIRNISPEGIERAVKAIDQATEILIFARGMSMNAGIELQRKLQLYRKGSTLLDNSESMNYYARQTTSDSLVIVFSLLGETRELIEAAKIAKEKGAKILAISAAENSSLSAQADISLIGYKSRLEVKYFELDVHSRIPLYILVRVLFDSYSIYKNQ